MLCSRWLGYYLDHSLGFNAMFEAYAEQSKPNMTDKSGSEVSEHSNKLPDTNKHPTWTS